MRNALALIGLIVVIKSLFSKITSTETFPVLDNYWNKIYKSEEKDTTNSTDSYNQSN